MKISNYIPETVVMAGVTLNKSKVKILMGSCGASNYETFYCNGTRYQVPAGKTLRIWAMRYHDLSNTVTSAGSTLGYGDTVVANGAAAPTNYVGLATGGDIGSMGQISASGIVEYFLGVDIPAGKYPCIKQNAASSCAVYLLCEEI